MTRTADRLVEALMLDVYPESRAALLDYGLAGHEAPRRYAALQYAVRRNGVTADQLHTALRQGRLTTLIRDHCPDKDVLFDDDDDHGDQP